MDDLQAILRLKSGDINGLDFLITKYQVKAVRTAYLVTRNRPMAEDVVATG
jgi:RNA polymerase sigma-70 factor (ECF subfamily)